MAYGMEKLYLNFYTYRHNFENHNAQLIEPGHMETSAQYDNVAKKFSELYINCSSATGSGNLFKKGDYIQPKGNTDTYRYPYQVTSDVTFSTGSNVTIPVHRPVLSQDGVALTSGGIKVGNDVRWQVKITNLPKYSVVPHDRIAFSSNFELVEVIT